MDRLVCVGSYTPDTGGRGAGITTFRWRGGVLEPLGGCSLASPSYLCWHPRLPVLCAASERADGMITALRAGPAGSLSVSSRLPSGGAFPCHLALTQDGRQLLCANYGGSLAAIALQDDGELAGVRAVVSRPGSLVHMAAASDDLVRAVDLGRDEICSYRLGTDGQLSLAGRCGLPEGTGPRHLATHGERGFLVGEVDSTVTVLALDPLPRVLASYPATAEPPVRPNCPAHIAWYGRRLYVSNRSADCLTVFTVAGDGTLGAARDIPLGAAWPRHFAMLGCRIIVAAERSDELAVLDLTGGATRRYPVGSPACVVLTR